MMSFSSGKNSVAWAAGLALAAAMLAQPGAAVAQGYFIPPQNAQPKPGAVARPAPRAPAPTQQALPPPPPVELPSGLAGVTTGDSTDQADQSALAQLPSAPVPELPPLPKGTVPPAPIIGVLGVPEVMRAATASQQVEKVITERREKLQADAQKGQAEWHDLQQQLSADRATLNPDQVRAKERDLQERITNDQKSWRDRNRIIQETAQYSLNQIERTLIAVIRQVAESRGMNLVLHRAQVALNINEFDITDQVTVQMNKVMPSITIAPDGVSPLTQATAQAGAQAGAVSQAPTPTPASAPPTSPPARH